MQWWPFDAAVPEERPHRVRDRHVHDGIYVHHRDYSDPELLKAWRQEEENRGRYWLKAIDKLRLLRASAFLCTACGHGVSLHASSRWGRYLDLCIDEDEDCECREYKGFTCRDCYDFGNAKKQIKVSDGSGRCQRHREEVMQFALWSRVQHEITILRGWSKDRKDYELRCLRRTHQRLTAMKRWLRRGRPGAPRSQPAA